MGPRYSGDILGFHGDVVWSGAEVMAALREEAEAVGRMMLLSSLYLTLRQQHEETSCYEQASQVAL